MIAWFASSQVRLLWSHSVWSHLVISRQHISCSLDKPSLVNKAMLFWFKWVSRSHAEYLVDAANPDPTQIPRNCRNSKWSSLTWHSASSWAIFVTRKSSHLEITQSGDELDLVGLNSKSGGTNTVLEGKGELDKGRTRQTPTKDKAGA